MTVAELIAALSKMPQDATVDVEYDGGFAFVEIDDVYFHAASNRVTLRES